MPHARTKDFTGYPELELSIMLSQVDNSFDFLNYMNTGKTVTGEEFPRNTTERSTINRNHDRVKQCRQLLKQILNHKQTEQPINSIELAAQQFLHDS